MIKVAIVGTGGIAKSHIEGYLRFPDRCRIAALANRTTEKAESLKAKYNLDCRVEGDFDRLLGDPDIDLVSICTPPATHAPLATAFLRAGKHVLLEKPMASSPAECDAILAAEKESGKLLSVVAQNRFLTPTMRLKKVLESGMVGRINHIQVDSFWWRGPSYYDIHWRGRWDVEGGGCTLNHSVHHIDIMLWLVGMPSEVVSIFGNVAHDNSEVEDISISLLRFNAGFVGQLTSSLNHYGERQSIAIQAEKAAVSMPWHPASYLPMENGFPKGDNEAFLAELNAFHDAIPEVRYPGHAGQIDDVLTALETGGQPLVTGIDGRNAIAVIQGIYKSALEKRGVALPLTGDDPFYTREGLLARAVKFHEKTRNIAAYKDNTIVVGGMNIGGK